MWVRERYPSYFWPARNDLWSRGIFLFRMNFEICLCNSNKIQGEKTVWNEHYIVGLYQMQLESALADLTSTEGDHLHTEWFHARQTTGGTRSCGLLEQVKCFGMTLLVSTTACGAEWRTFIQEMKLVQKPNFQSCVSSTSNVVKCLYASKEMSFIFCRCWRFSKDCLPFIKPVWSGWGILFKTVSSHRAKALESILLSQQTRLAGLYESHFDGSLPLLRWTDITAWDRVGGSHPCWNATGAV